MYSLPPKDIILISTTFPLIINLKFLKQEWLFLILKQAKVQVIDNFQLCFPKIHILLRIIKNDTTYLLYIQNRRNSFSYSI